MYGDDFAEKMEKKPESTEDILKRISALDTEISQSLQEPFHGETDETDPIQA